MYKNFNIILDESTQNFDFENDEFFVRIVDTLLNKEYNILHDNNIYIRSDNNIIYYGTGFNLENSESINEYHPPLYGAKPTENTFLFTHKYDFFTDLIFEPYDSTKPVFFSNEKWNVSHEFEPLRIMSTYSNKFSIFDNVYFPIYKLCFDGVCLENVKSVKFIGYFINTENYLSTKDIPTILNFDKNNILNINELIKKDENDNEFYMLIKDYMIQTSYEGTIQLK